MKKTADVNSANELYVGYIKYLGLWSSNAS